MKHLFKVWESFAAGVKAAPHVLLVSDYDGTLTPIVSRPEEALLSPDVGEKLRSISLDPAFSLGIISGRSLAETRRVAGIKGIYYAGNHGLEIEGPGLNFINPQAKAAQAVINKVGEQLSTGLRPVPGIIVENKGLSLSVHYRMVNESEISIAEGVFQRITAPLLRSGKIKITSGKRVWEVRPPLDWDKGKAVEIIIRQVKKEFALKTILTIYLGDDTTDEDVFRILARGSGWGIFVGGNNDSSSAGYFLNSTVEVEEFLARLISLR